MHRVMNECQLLSIAKLQNLKAIHNCRLHYLLYNQVVINRKTTKFESNSQRILIVFATLLCCYQSQNYKIWKQFTTDSGELKEVSVLLSIAKLQNLKAIHNDEFLQNGKIEVVINRKTTKFESNSQLNCLPHSLQKSCYQSQNYKIWKQFTT